MSVVPDLLAAADRIRDTLDAVGVKASLSEAELHGDGVLIVAPTMTGMLSGHCRSAEWTLYVLTADVPPRQALRRLGALLDKVTAVCPAAGLIEPVVIDSVGGAPRSGFKFPFDDRF